MMLIEQISNLEVELDKVTQGQSNVVAINNLDTVYQNISPVLEELEVHAIRREICRQLPAEFALVRLADETVEESNKALAAVAAFLEAWDELENKYEISQKDVCHNTRDAIASLNKSLETTISHTYTMWRAQVRDEVSVSDLDLEKQDTSSNLKENAAQYRSLYQRLQDSLNVPDPTLVIIDDIASLKERLLIARDKMEFNQPEDVVTLFKHLKQIGNNGRAPLSLLTDEVLKWMKDEGQEGFFYVGDKRVR